MPTAGSLPLREQPSRFFYESGALAGIYWLSKLRWSSLLTPGGTGSVPSHKSVGPYNKEKNGTVRTCPPTCPPKPLAKGEALAKAEAIPPLKRIAANNALRAIWRAAVPCSHGIHNAQYWAHALLRQNKVPSINRALRDRTPSRS